MAVASSAALLLLGVACSVPTPSELDDTNAPPNERVSPDEIPSASGVAGPKFIPYDKAPRLQNPGETQRLLKEESEAWPQLRATTMLLLNIDAVGSVAKAEVQKSSGFFELDAAALRVARQMRFSPARNKGIPTAVWVVQSIQFNEPDPSNPRDNSGSSEDIELSNVGESQEPHQALSPAEAGVYLQELFRQTGVDPEQIESVEVIRAPAYSALWNGRTDNGVIVLETKRIDAAEKARWERSLEDERGESYRRFAKLSGINPDEIKSIHVIKGPSAEAIWGGRPNTGVIILRTRGD
jgi:TonB family protein